MPPLHSLDSRIRELPSLYPAIEIPDTIEELCPSLPEPTEESSPPPSPHWLARFAGIEIGQYELAAIKYGLPCAVALVAVYETALAVLWVFSAIFSHLVLLGLIAALLFGALRVVASHRSTPKASLTREPLWAARPVAAAAAPRPIEVTAVREQPRRSSLSRLFLGEERSSQQLKPTEQSSMGRFFMGDERSQPAAMPVAAATEPRERGGIGRLFLGDDRPQPTPVASPSPSPFTGEVRPERSSLGRLFLGDERETVPAVTPAQVWAAELRENGHLQAKGTYADGSGNYCAVGMVTHRSGRMTHRGMRREFGTGFVRDVERYNDSTRATFSDVADYIEKKKG